MNFREQNPVISDRKAYLMSMLINEIKLMNIFCVNVVHNRTFKMYEVYQICFKIIMQCEENDYEVMKLRDDRKKE